MLKNSNLILKSNKNDLTTSITDHLGYHRRLFSCVFFSFFSFSLYHLLILGLVGWHRGFVHSSTTMVVYILVDVSWYSVVYILVGISWT